MSRRNAKLNARRALWLRYYLDSSNPETFMNGTEAAIHAGYKCKNRTSYSGIGTRLRKKLAPLIRDWLNENGLSEEALKGKLVELLNANTVKHFAHNGVVMDERTIADNATRRAALQMALKMRGMDGADKVELTGAGGGPIVTAGVAIRSDMPANEAASLYARMIKGK
jgi:hypothetical protein